jgi:ketosteroid isomerase-like protein
VLLLAGVFDGGDSATAGRSTSTPRPSSPTSPTSPTSPGGAVSAAAAEDVVGAFEKAFKDENAAALASTLAQDVVFESTAPVVGTTSHSGRTEVTSNFEQQFPLTESYTFTREATRTSDSATIVSGRFTQDIGATLVSGSVRFSVADVDGKPLIVRIASTVSG